MLYPLKFKPRFKDKIWGGNKMRTRLGMDFSPLPNCGELWALSGVPGNESVVVNGFLAGNSLNELLEIYMDDLVGEKAFKRDSKEFPLLVKIIDANDFLSIQVHPDDALAARRHLGNGKTEMWYILDAEPGAELITGFNRPVNRDIYLQHLKDKNLREILNVEKVTKGDLFFIPAGRIHALGPGILLAEIQQSSDTTYRIYDWDRVDEQGRGRELHTEEALEAIDFGFSADYRTHYKARAGESSLLKECPWFSTHLLQLDRKTEKDYSALDSFVILLCIEGQAQCTAAGHTADVKAGEALLIPAMLDASILEPHGTCSFLEVYLP